MTSSIVAIIPARGGSKSIPLKNIRPLLGKPLVAYTIAAALDAQVAQRVIVSTDSGEIADVSRAWGAKVIARPTAISGDDASTESALLHALDELAASGFRPDWVLTLQPTSPLRSARTIRDFVSAYAAVSETCDSMLSVVEDRAYKWTGTANQRMLPLFPDAARRRQDRTPLYSEDSALYISRVDALRATGSIFGQTVAGFVIDALEAVDVNEPNDLVLAGLLLARRLKS